MQRHTLMILAGLLSALLATPVMAQEDEAEDAEPRERSVEERLDRLERMINARDQLALTRRIRDLENQIRSMRGVIEEQQHLIERLETRQRDLYADLDERLQRLSDSGTTPPEPAQEALPIVDIPADEDTAEDDEADTGEEDLTALYRQGFNDLQDRNYQAAQENLRDFLDRAGDHRLAANAWYWLGESYYARRDFDAALEAFNRVAEEYPDSDKAADAHLKAGFVHYERSQWGRAREALERVVEEYPDATASRLARNRLERMDDEGV